MAIWDRVLMIIEQNLSKSSYETWFKDTALLPYDEDTDTLVIETANEFARDWIESRYLNLIGNVLHNITGKHYKLQFIVNKKDASDEIDFREYPAYQNDDKPNIEQKLDLILKELQTLNERVHTIEADHRELSQSIRTICDQKG